jgi:hypothetical protein
MIMQLVDAATVTTGPKSGWQLGTEKEARECAVVLALTDVCEVDSDNVLVDGSAGIYTTRPVGLTGTLSQPAQCAQPDDPEWLNGAMKDSLEFAIGRALVTQPITGFGEDGIWVGATDVVEEPAGATLAEGVAKGRTTWYSHVIPDGGKRPLLHVSPTSAPALAVAGVLHVLSTGETVTIWGDDVVMSPGYDIADPLAFWTGPIKVTVSSAETTDQVYNTRQNRAQVTSGLVAVVDIPPCSIVRVGPPPTP